MTTYEEWRVTGQRSTHPHVCIITGETGRDPEADAREHVRLCLAPGPWTDGPHLHKRTVTVTDWTEVDA